MFEINDHQRIVALLAESGINRQQAELILSPVEIRAIRLKRIPDSSVELLQQEMSKLGGVAVGWRDQFLKQNLGDVLLLGTRHIYAALADRLAESPPTDSLADELRLLLQEKPATGVMELPHGRNLTWGKKTLIMGIINRSPESFAENHRQENTAQALRRTLELVEEGADIIDIGGCSSRPGAEFVSLEEERRRVLPLVEALARHDVIISVDTFRAAVAADAIAGGAHMINNIGEWSLDPELLPVLAEHNCPVVLMHNRMHIRHVSSGDLIGDMIADLDAAITRAEAEGLKRDRIIVDPGVGFGPAGAEDRMIVKQLRAFRRWGLPILVGLSRKRFIGAEAGLLPQERLEGSLAAQTLAIANGAHILRVHDVQAARRAAEVADAILH